MNNYTPPPGRPRSTPPALPSSWETPATPARKPYKHVTEADVAAWSADFAAGMLLKHIAAKHSRPRSTIGIALKKAGVTTPPAADEPPLPLPPTDRPVRQYGESSHAFGARVQKWMMETDPAYRERVRLNKSAGQRARALRVKRQREREARRAAEVVAVAPTPTFWQRLLGWFR